MRHGVHHIHQRKRIHSKKEEYPHPDKKIKLLDRVCMVFSVVMPATTIPQIYKTYVFQDVTGVSLWMWILYCFAVVPWLIYGIVHKAKPIIVLNILWLIVQVIMIVGVLLYG
ncbi:MAG: SemiSWEET family transporter [Desulfovermiculus sp.]